MADETDDPRVEKVARSLAQWHGSAYLHSNRDGEMQTVASSYAGHRWTHASDQYANANWKQYRGAAKCAIAMVDAEREACARVASGCSYRDCADRGVADPETGEVPCSAEARGEVCVCAELSDLAHGIAGKIRLRSS